jgi:hypothetical protein
MVHFKMPPVTHGGQRREEQSRHLPPSGLKRIEEKKET